MYFVKQKHEQSANSLQCSEEILSAIEQVTSESFEKVKIGPDSSVPDQDEFIKNAAYKLWEEGGREDEILAALPTEDAVDGEEVFWDSIFAEFDGEKWTAPSI
jgi:hypothetical protein